MPFLRTCLLLLLITHHAAPSFAQDVDIIVTGHPLADSAAAPAYAVTVLGRDQIITAASGRIEDVLGTVAGFQSFRRSDSRATNPSAQGVTLRALGGNAASRSLVLLDGVPMADPMFGAVALSALDPARLARITVQRGGGSGAFGAGAVAGTIRLESAGPDALGAANAEALVNDRGESEMSASIAPRLGSGFAVISGRWDRGAGFWSTPVAQRVPASVRARYDDWSLSLRGVAPLGPDIELQARGLIFADHHSLRFAGADNNSSGGDASLRIIARGAWQFDALVYGQVRGFRNTVISASTYRPALDQRRTPSNGFGGKFELRPPLAGQHPLRLGMDWRLVKGDLFEDAYNASTGALTLRRQAGGRIYNQGLFAESDLRLGSVLLTGGARLDHYAIKGGYLRESTAAGVITSDLNYAERSGWTPSLRGGALWTIGGGLVLRGSAYSGLRLPTINELYRQFVLTAPLASGGSVAITTRANPALLHERLVGYEAGLDYAKGPLSFSLTAFDNRLHHAIANVTIGPNLRQRMNVDAIQARGLELGLGAKLGNFALDGSLALTDSTIISSGIAAPLRGLRPAQVPKVTGSITLSWQQHGWHLAATLRHTGAQYEDDLQSDVLPAATTLSAYAEFPLAQRLHVVLRAENITNTAVITRNQAGSLDLGAPRTLWIGLAIR